MTADLALSLLRRGANGAQILEILDSIAGADAPIIPMTPEIRRSCQELYPEIQF